MEYLYIYHGNWFVADHVQIKQPSLNVMKDETVQLDCEIQYEMNTQQKFPFLFWFEDIYDVRLNLFHFLSIPLMPINYMWISVETDRKSNIKAIFQPGNTDFQSK